MEGPWSAVELVCFFFPSLYAYAIRHATIIFPYQFKVVMALSRSYMSVRVEWQSLPMTIAY
jgi:hypothetical protein